MFNTKTTLKFVRDRVVFLVFCYTTIAHYRALKKGHSDKDRPHSGFIRNNS